QITVQETKTLIRDIRSILPGIALRTTFLVGFPGEEDDHFNRLCDFVEEMQFDRVGVFEYSHEENTPAWELGDTVSAEVKTDRARILMDTQREISLEKNLRKVGQTQKVLFDRKENGFFIGRTEADSPEVDNEVHVDAENAFVRIGDFALTRI